MFCRGNVLSVFGIGFSVSFSVMLFCSGNMLFFWMFIELIGLCSIPCFFVGELRLLSLFNYLLASSLASALVISGLMDYELVFLMYLGFLIKFGVFPFWGWVYNVVLGSPILAVWVLSCLLKVPVLFLCYFLTVACGFSFTDLVIGLSFVLLGLLIWTFSYSWRHCWCHMMLSSSYVVLLCAYHLPASKLFPLFVAYVFWVSVFLYFIFRKDSGGLRLVVSPVSYFFFCWVVLSFPFSFSVFYKLMMGCCVYSLSFPVFVGWVIYSVLEQSFILKVLSSMKSPTTMRVWSFII